MEIHLKAARVHAGLTQAEVAEAVGKTKNTIASYELYRTIPDIETSRKLAKLFGMTVDDIIWSKS